MPTCGLFRSEPDELRVGILPSAADLGQDFKFGAAGEETGWRFRPCKMAVPVPDVPLLKIFSFLDAFSLLQASRVNRVNALRRPPSVGGPPPPHLPPSTGRHTDPLHRSPSTLASRRPQPGAHAASLLAYVYPVPAPSFGSHRPSARVSAARLDQVERQVAEEPRDALGFGGLASFALRASPFVKRKGQTNIQVSLRGSNGPLEAPGNCQCFSHKNSKHLSLPQWASVVTVSWSPPVWEGLESRAGGWFTAERRAWLPEQRRAEEEPALGY